MSGYNRQCNRYAGDKSGNRTRRTNVDSGMQWKPKAKIATDRSLDSHHCCQKDHSSDSVLRIDLQIAITVVKEPVRCSLEDDGISKKEKRFGDKLKKDDDNDSASLKSRFDISPKRASNVIKLKPPLHVINKLKQNQIKRSVEGQTGEKSDVKDEASNMQNFKSQFDICPKRANHVILKTPLHVIEKEKRNQIKRSVEGQSFDMLRPGMVLMKGYISPDDQISIVKTCRELGISNGGFYKLGYSGGTKLHLKMMCLGKNWDPESGSYSELRRIDKSKPPGIPHKFHDLVKKAIQDSNEHMQENIANAKEGKSLPSMSPDICIVNFYTKTGKLGFHQDRDESFRSLKDGLPVVSFSIGDSAEFLYGDTRDMDEADKVNFVANEQSIESKVNHRSRN